MLEQNTRLSLTRPHASTKQRVAFPAQRRHVLYFLEHTRAYYRCFMDVDVDMTEVQRARAAAKQRGQRVGTVAIIAKAIALALRKYPDANVVASSGLFPKLYRYDTIACKVVLDKTIAGVRSVAAAVMPSTDGMDVTEIQARIDRFRDTPAEELSELRGLLMVQRLPVWLGRLISRVLSALPLLKAKYDGTFALTSLGHQPVLSVCPIIANTMSFVAAGVFDRVVVVDGAAAIRPIMRLTLGFDHAAMDGALAVQVLCETKTLLETWS